LNSLTIALKLQQLGIFEMLLEEDRKYRVPKVGRELSAKQSAKLYVRVLADSFSDIVERLPQQCFVSVPRVRASTSMRLKRHPILCQNFADQNDEPEEPGENESASKVFKTQTGAVNSTEFSGETSNSGTVAAFLDRVYTLARDQEDRRAIDVVYQFFNYLMLEHRYEVCDEILRRLDLRRISALLMVAFLTITAAGSDELNSRQLFYSRAKQAIETVRGRDATTRLLAGLK
jgi:hypothetical protein